MGGSRSWNLGRRWQAVLRKHCKQGWCGKMESIGWGVERIQGKALWTGEIKHANVPPGELLAVSALPPPHPLSLVNLSYFPKVCLQKTCVLVVNQASRRCPGCVFRTPSRGAESTQSRGRRVSGWQSATVQKNRESKRMEIREEQRREGIRRRVQKTNEMIYRRGCDSALAPVSLSLSLSLLYL